MLSLTRGRHAYHNLLKNQRMETHRRDSKKRAVTSRDDDALDSQLSELCAKLGAVNTDDHETLTMRLVEALGVDDSVANFYLEASDFSLVMASTFHRD